jgi:uncharacterized protein
MEIITAFGIGLLGSLHCIGMCGPIALAIPLRSNRVLSILVYNSGRIFTYASIGILFGLVGKGFVMAGLQQTLSIAAGALIIAIVLIPFLSDKIRLPFYQKAISHLRNRFTYLFQKKTYASLFFIGILNGLLPCGLIYLAAIGSLATGDPFSGSMFMIAFGLGTLPAMLSVGMLRSFITPLLKLRINTALPLITISLGCLLIVRGMNLGIPYLSPKTNIENCITHCCQ